MVTVRPVSDRDRKQGKGDSEATVTLITKHYGTISHVLSIPMHYGYTVVVKKMSGQNGNTNKNPLSSSGIVFTHTHY